MPLRLKQTNNHLLLKGLGVGGKSQVVGLKIIPEGLCWFGAIILVLNFELFVKALLNRKVILVVVLFPFSKRWFSQKISQVHIARSQHFRI